MVDSLASLMSLFSVVESVGPLILAPYPGAKGRRVLAKAKLACPCRGRLRAGGGGGRLVCPSRLLAGGVVAAF